MWESFSRVFEYVMILAVLAGLWWWQRRSRRKEPPDAAESEHSPPTLFRQMNDGWNAHPNIAEVDFSIDGTSLWIGFTSNKGTGEPMYLEFARCRRFRFTAINDRAWYNGDCRFSRVAPAWGQFFEVLGDFQEDKVNDPWVAIDPAGGDRNFLFYFRDFTLEVIAAEASLRPKLDVAAEVFRPFESFEDWRPKTFRTHSHQGASP